MSRFHMAKVDMYKVEPRKVKLISFTTADVSIGGRDLSIHPAPDQAGLMDSSYSSSYRPENGILIPFGNGIDRVAVAQKGFEVLDLKPNEWLPMIKVDTRDCKTFLHAAEEAVVKLANALGLYPIIWRDFRRETAVVDNGEKLRYANFLNRMMGTSPRTPITMRADCDFWPIRLLEANFQTDQGSRSIVFEVFSHGDVIAYFAHVDFGLGGDSKTLCRERADVDEVALLEKAIGTTLVTPLKTEHWHFICVAPHVTSSKTAFHLEVKSIVESLEMLKEVLAANGFSNIK